MSHFMAFRFCRSYTTLYCISGRGSAFANLARPTCGPFLSKDVPQAMYFRRGHLWAFGPRGNNGCVFLSTQGRFRCRCVNVRRVIQFRFPLFTVSIGLRVVVFGVSSHFHRCQVVREARYVRIFYVRLYHAISPRRIVFGRSTCFQRRYPSFLILYGNGLGANRRVFLSINTRCTSKGL